MKRFTEYELRKIIPKQKQKQQQTAIQEFSSYENRVFMVKKEKDDLLTEQIND